MIKNINDFTSKSSIKPILQAVFVTPEKIVATDSYKLVEIKEATGATENFSVIMPKGKKTFDTVEKRGDMIAFTKKGDVFYSEKLVNDDFPKYESVIPTTPPLRTIKVNAEFLAQVATAFIGQEQFNKVEIDIYEDNNKPLIFRATTKTGKITALLMLLSK